MNTASKCYPMYNQWGRIKRSQSAESVGKLLLSFSTSTHIYTPAICVVVAIFRQPLSGAWRRMIRHTSSKQSKKCVNNEICPFLTNMNLVLVLSCCWLSLQQSFFCRAESYCQSGKEPALWLSKEQNWFEMKRGLGGKGVSDGAVG